MMPLVQRRPWTNNEGGNAKGQALGFASPVQEAPANPRELRHSILQVADCRDDLAIAALEFMGLIESIWGW